MIALTLQEIADITGGRLDCVEDPSVQVTGFVEFDSRKVTPGGLFLALPGARVDGHDFAEKAVASGAVAVLAARPVGVSAIVVEPKGKVEGDGANADIYANDEDGSAAAVIEALSALARAVTQRLATDSALNIVGVTGSAGKTSTKDLIATIFRAAGETVAPPGSFNNEVGLPYTALRCDEHTEYLVAEMSARGIGHIRHLTNITAPKVGVVLNVGSAHLGEFGSRENIAQAKGELVEALPSAKDGGVAVLNADDPFVAGMAPRTDAKVVYYSAVDKQGSNVQYYATQVQLDDVARASFMMHTPDAHPLPVKLQVFGAHQVSNALAAAAAAIELGLSAELVANALSGHRIASEHRMDVRNRRDGVTLIDDSYNANPDSMRAAIAALAYTAAARPDARSIAVLGEMGELGEDALDSHRQLGSELAKYHVDHLVAVGTSVNTRAMAEAAQAKGINTSICADVDEAAKIVDGLLRTAPVGVDDWPNRDAKDVVLVKASNAQRLWLVAEKLNQS
ncbi:UDP-N-acetylmuramoyl-tripeptide--D-alanyl-D-alanine ligase [Corynebacterium sp. HMSC06D04]|uniref:UDP-N-acetylmuramoyl-tripeptide--D-alanyl-D-alanine ligase n=1 Tax=Corynebacterium simulans TaxID=146827 RepID=A0ABR5V9B4_9CORY|nr:MULTISPECIES: UDP-N-acetylmuramoyl-tripeptide--D-alanyl-D-alanine ligase [Corynebacterium]KXU18057.1 UDP-N-acetylmuramoyl-tripeptide--D-alanyl-D-alanine ligase family protein [Corynebacterium simulans]OFR37160.1 UDP-N-acetylmuramoyl-tripeptide--D-alanyl-D-alanine ligase [Corynebacterium sp. HMSC077D03]OFT34016.1 UDP-N-acetylmuramoyl-tripeptide--D-alanyl-D-alanine ligase [Corynebacterium sp. HMSC08C04]OFT50031.1 UDP-N-acetylmuramoyl-tripeptide--D-alanyl-D-alanine ligase [Corynebacterium sp. H